MTGCVIVGSLVVAEEPEPDTDAGPGSIEAEVDQPVNLATV